jgi:hypothetical protein
MSKSSKMELKWFWCYLIQMTVQKAKLHNAETIVEIWKNLVVVQASTYEEAISKATEFGLREQGDDRGSLRLDGKPALRKFLGIGNMGLCHDGIEDGAEISWELIRCRHHNAKKLTKSKGEIISRLKKELLIN